MIPLLLSWKCERTTTNELYVRLKTHSYQRLQVYGFIHIISEIVPLYGVRKSIAIVRKWAIIWVNYNEGMTGKGLKER